MFIVIEGPDGSGKTTLAKELAANLNQLNIPTVYTYEPTRISKFGRNLRNMMRNGDISDIYNFADLFVEDRKEHLEKIIVPALKRNEFVVCDRYKYSALVYQQIQGVDLAYLLEISRQCLVPDIVYVLIPSNVEILLKRIATRKKEDIFEKKEFLATTIEYYKHLKKYFPSEQIVFLDAAASIQDNINQILKKII